METIPCYETRFTRRSIIKAALGATGVGMSTLLAGCGKKEEHCPVPNKENQAKDSPDCVIKNTPTVIPTPTSPEKLQLICPPGDPDPECS